MSDDDAIHRVFKLRTAWLDTTEYSTVSVACYAAYLKAWRALTDAQRETFAVRLNRLPLKR